MWLVAAAAAVWLVAGYFAATGPRSLLAKDPAPSSSAPTDEVSSPGSAVGSPSGTTAAPTAAPSATSSAGPAASAPSAPVDASACVAALFAPGTFRKQPDFEFLCIQANPRTGGTDVRARVVTGAGGKLTDGMREWAGLAWYEAAAYAVLRARCCASPPPLRWSFELACPVDESVARLERAIVAGDRLGVDGAVKDYTKQVRCLSKFGQTSNFGQTGSPGPGVSLLKIFLDRALGETSESKD